MIVVLPADPPEHVRQLMETLRVEIVEDPSLERPKWWRWYDEGRDGFTPLANARARYEISRLSAAERTGRQIA